jgi:hypothetical protein
MKKILLLLLFFCGNQLFAQDDSIIWRRLVNQGKNTTEYIYYGFDMTNRGKTYYAYEAPNFKKKDLILVKKEGNYIFLKFEEYKDTYQFEYPNETASEVYPLPPYLLRINPDGSKSKFVLEDAALIAEYHLEWVISDNLALRTEPNVNAAVLARFKAGDSLKVLGSTYVRIEASINGEKTEGNWLKAITFSGKIGYVFEGGLCWQKGCYPTDPEISKIVQVVPSGYIVKAQNGQTTKVAYESRNFKLVQYLKELDYMVFSGSLTAVLGSSLVDLQNGKYYDSDTTDFQTTWSEVVLSPSQKYMLTINITSQQDFYIYELRPLLKQIKKIKIPLTSEESVGSIEWLNDKQLKIKILHLEPSKRGEKIINVF